MAKSRLVELYPLQIRVEIKLGDSGWQSGTVMAHQHPGIWVQDHNGRSWFVTNRRHIRPLDSDQDHHEA